MADLIRSETGHTDPLDGLVGEPTNGRGGNRSLRESRITGAGHTSDTLDQATAAQPRSGVEPGADRAAQEAGVNGWGTRWLAALPPRRWLAPTLAKFGAKTTET
jgi:hypothetical protein